MSQTYEGSLGPPPWPAGRRRRGQMGGRRPAGGPARCIWVRTKWAASFRSKSHPGPCHIGHTLVAVSARKKSIQTPQALAESQSHTHIAVESDFARQYKEAKGKTVSNGPRQSNGLLLFRFVVYHILIWIVFFFFFDEGSISYYLSNIPYVFFYGEYLNFKIHTLLILNKRSDYKYIQGIKTIRVYLYIKVNF